MKFNSARIFAIPFVVGAVLSAVLYTNIQIVTDQLLSSEHTVSGLKCEQFGKREVLRVFSTGEGNKDSNYSYAPAVGTCAEILNELQIVDQAAPLTIVHDKRNKIFGISSGEQEFLSWESEIERQKAIFRNMFLFGVFGAVTLYLGSRIRLRH